MHTEEKGEEVNGEESIAEPSCGVVLLHRLARLQLAAGPSLEIFISANAGILPSLWCFNSGKSLQQVLCKSQTSRLRSNIYNNVALSEFLLCRLSQVKDHAFGRRGARADFKLACKDWVLNCGQSQLPQITAQPNRSTQGLRSSDERQVTL